MAYSIRDPQFQSGAYWTLSTLTERGWNRQLRMALLPKPEYLPRKQGGYVKAWRREDVLAAELKPLFRASAGRNRPEPEPPPQQQTAPAGQPFPDAARVEGFLTKAWEAGSGNDSLYWVLARRYHQGLMTRLSTLSGERNVRPSQASAWIQEFLALERRFNAAALPSVLRNFLRAHTWLARNLRSPLASRLAERYVSVLYVTAENTANNFTDAQPEADLDSMVRREDFPVLQLLQDGLASVWSTWYVPAAIRTSLSLLVALNPKDEYPEARAMHRRFIIHQGGTNTGKTYEGYQRLIRAKTGIYLAPLRLLALEAQETLLDAGIRCSLTTGEEEDVSEDDTHVAATAEKLNLKACYDVAVIDECQMIADRTRGYAWTQAILGVLAPEVHLCTAPEARSLLIRLIESCGDTWEVVTHERRTPLICMSHTVDFEHIMPGDALITFSKVGVLSIAEDLRQNGKEPAIIYGALPYSTRRRQMEGFLQGDMKYVVATDAIGMGLNLPIRRIIFTETEKFDGTERRQLKPEEIRQIAGRAGRYGMYSQGFVGATQNLEIIRAGLETPVPPLQEAVAGFSDLVLQVDFDLLEVLTEWNRMPTVEPYVKLDITRYIALITKMRETGIILPKDQELKAANIPFDETDEGLRELFFQYLQAHQRGEPPDPPALSEEERTLPMLEQHYRKLDLYFSFSRTFGYPLDEDRLYDSREQVADEINEILLHRLRNNIRFCEVCGRALPLHHKGRLCDACWRTRRKQEGPRHWH